MENSARFILAAALALTVLALIPAESRAQNASRTVSVPSVWARNPGDELLAQELTAALRLATERVPGWTVSNLTIPLVELMRACNPEENPGGECYARMAGVRDSTVVRHLFIFAGLSRTAEGEGAPLEISLLLYDAATNRSVGEAVSRPVARIASLEERNRLAGEWVTALAAQIAPEPRVRPATPVRATPPVSRPRPHGSRPVDSPRDSGTVRQVIGWSLLGASAVSLATTIGIWVRLNAIQNNPEVMAYRERADVSVSDVCDLPSDGSPQAIHVHDLCSEGSTFEVLQYVFLGLTGAFATGGVIALLLNPSAERAVSLVPSVGRGQANLRLMLAF